MHFACISPTAYLEQYSARGNFQLCLAQVAIRDTRYFEWYRERRKQGDFVILDNGAYEGELVDPDELLRIAAELNPNVLTVPDKLNDAEESKRMATHFLTYRSGFPLMRVLQHESRDTLEWLHLINELEGTYPWLAVPRVLGTFRPEVANLIHCNSYAKVHAFGWTGNLNEVRELAKLGVTSIDTSAPVWRGFNGCDLGDKIVQAWERNGPKFDPLYVHKDEDGTELTIESNLDAINRACVAF